MVETFSAYWKFLKKPQLLKLVSDKAMLWKDIFWLLALDFAFAGVVFLIYYLLLKFDLIVKYEEYDIFKRGFATAMILGAVVAPLAEEFLFRWQLRRPKVSVWFVLISMGFLMSSFTTNEYARFFIFIFLLVAGLVIFLTIGKLNRLKAIRVFRGYYIFLFYYTAVIFGYVHIFNMKGLTINDPSFLIYISSQLFSGLSMGYIRVKYGLGYSILLHCCFNAISIPIAWVFS